MSALLWVLVVLGALNTAAVVWFGMTGSLPSVTPRSRAIDALITAGMGAWALWLLAKGA